MTDWILRRNEDGKFVNQPGALKSYITNASRAQRFPTREAADANKCDNETAVLREYWLDEGLK